MRTIPETLQPDVPYRVRQRLGPLITRLGETLGQPEYRLRETEYVGTIQQPLDKFTETSRTTGSSGIRSCGITSRRLGRSRTGAGRIDGLGWPTGSST